MRIRTVKPEFWEDEGLASVPAETRLLAIGLLNVADDEGYFKANAKLIKAQIFPYEDSMNIPGMLQELSKIGYLSLGEGCDDAKPYGHVVKFTTHQVVSKARPSKIKDIYKITECSGNVPGTVYDDSIRKGKEGKGKEGNISSSKAELTEVFDHWVARMGKAGNAKFTKDRETKVRARIKEGYTVEQLKQAVDGCAESPWHQGENPNNQVYNDLELICRSGSQVEKFIAVVDKPQEGGVWI